MTASVLVQAVSIIPPTVAGASTSAQSTTLAGSGLLFPHVVVQAVSVAPGARTGTAHLVGHATLAPTLARAPRVVVGAVGTGALAAHSTQAQTLVMTQGTTGPIPRPTQRATLVGWPQVALAGNFAVPVPQRTLVAAPLLLLHGAATSSAYTWLVAGVVPRPSAATGTQQQTERAQAALTIPHFGASRPVGTATLAGTAQVRHPLVALGVALWRARSVQRSALGAGLDLLVPRGDYRSARGLADGAYQFRSASIGGEAMSALAVPPTPQVVTLRSTERDRLFRLNFAGDLPARDTVQSAQVTVWAQPERYEPAAQTNVTADLLRSYTCVGAAVLLYLGNATQAVGTQYTVRVVMTSVGGLVLHETIDKIICDM